MSNSTYENQYKTLKNNKIFTKTANFHFASSIFHIIHFVPLTGSFDPVIWHSYGYPYCIYVSSHKWTVLFINVIKKQQGESFRLFNLIRQAEYIREPYLLLETLKSITNKALTIEGMTILDGSRKPLADSAPLGLCLTGQVEASLKRDIADLS